jgi:hypothetical protein
MRIMIRPCEAEISESRESTTSSECMLKRTEQHAQTDAQL